MRMPEQMLSCLRAIIILRFHYAKTNAQIDARMASAFKR